MLIKTITAMVMGTMIMTGGVSVGDAEVDPVEARIEDALNRRGEHYANRLRLFIEETPKEPKGGIVFLGDSLTEGNPAKTAFPDRIMINRGIGGDKITGVQERLDVSVTNLEPSTVFLLIGINEFVWFDVEYPERLETEYDSLFAELKTSAPDARIVVQSLLPVSNRLAYAFENIKKANKTQEALSEKYGFEYVDLFSRMSGPDGAILEPYTADGVHLTLVGVLAWYEGIFNAEEVLTASLELNGYYHRIYALDRPLDKVDPPADGDLPGNRGADELVVYTPAYHQSTTGTNQWGKEAIVMDGIVTEIGGNNLEIPKNGFIISGHGLSAGWISFNLEIGTAVELREGMLYLQKEEESNLGDMARLQLLRDDLVYTLAQFKAAGQVDSEEAKEAEALALEVIEARIAMKPINAERLEEISTRRTALLEKIPNQS